MTAVARVPDPRIESWERRSEWPLAVVAATFLAAYAWPILQPNLSDGLRRSCQVVVYVCWIALGVEYLVRFSLARPRAQFLRRTVPELACLALPVLRPLRLLRLVVLVNMLNRKATSSFRGRVALYVGSAVVLVVFVCSLAVLDAERGRSGANIETFGDALWWAVATMTSVRYGDRYPVTVGGRLVAVGLMICGIGLLGVITASIATWLLERVRELDEQATTGLDVELGAIKAQLTGLEQLLQVRTPPEPQRADGVQGPVAAGTPGAGGTPPKSE